ncbi:MAG: hypothetical protein WCO96_09185, partial [Actinomycetes bacterium]
MSSAVPSASAASIAGLSNGLNHSCLLFTGGSVSCWGSNSSGQLGDGTRTDRSRAVTVSGVSTAIQLSASEDHTCALIRGAKVQCWGENSDGQLGDGTRNESAVPVTVQGISGAIQVSTGGSHSCAILRSGVAQCWGSNANGQLGTGSKASRSLKPVPVAGLTNATRIAAGRFHTCAVRKTHQVACWGYNGYGALGDGTVTARPKLVTVPGILNAAEVSVGPSLSCAVLDNSLIKCWGGIKGAGMVGDGSADASTTPVYVSGILNAESVSIGESHACALTSTRSVTCWGANSDGQLGDGTTVGRPLPEVVSGLADIVGLASGRSHSCAASAGGTAWCWGLNRFGSLGDETTARRSRPVPVSGLTTPPTLRTGPPALTNGPAVFAFVGLADDMTYSCSVDSGPFRPCTSPTTVDGLADGIHTFAVRQANRDGTISAPTDPRIWTLDTTPPAPPTLLSTPPSVTNANSIAVSASGEPGSTLSCSVDKAAYVPCTSPATFSGFAVGAHSLWIRQTDAAGNPGLPAIVNWAVDRTGPAGPTFTSTPGKVSGNTSPQFTFLGVETAGSYLCSVDGGAWTECASPKIAPGLGAGSHTFAVKQIDRAGNVGSASTHSWLIDLTPPPPPTVTSRPPARTDSLSATFSMTGEPGATFLCSLDGDPPIPCTSPYSVTISKLVDGPHEMAISQVDASGNAGSPVTVGWSVDLTNPLPPTLTSSLPTRTRQTSASVSFTGRAGASFSCSLDGAPFSQCSSPKVVEGLGDGVHTLRVRQTAQSGMVGEPTTITWEVELTPPPTPQITAQPQPVTNRRDATFAFSGAPGNKLQCSRDGRAFKACVSPVTLTNVWKGSHSFAVQQIDDLGNRSASATARWTIDIAPPAPPVFLSGSAPVYIDGLKRGQTNANSATFRFVAPSDQDFSCQLDSTAPVPCRSPFTLNGLKDGDHRFTVSHSDPAGNSSTSKVAKWRVDTVKPTISSVAVDFAPGMATLLIDNPGDLTGIELAETTVDAFDDYYVAARALDINTHHREIVERIRATALAQYSV